MAWRWTKKATINPVNGKMIEAVRAVGQINIFGLRRCEKLLRLLLPYLRVKKDQATCMLEWIERRLSIPTHQAIATRSTTYDEVDDRYYLRMAELKKAGVPQTTPKSYAVRHGAPDDGKI